MTSGTTSAGLRRVAGSSAWLLAENVLRVSATALMALWVARMLGPAAYGVLAFATALLAVFLVPGTLGLELPVLARLSRGDAPGRVLGTALAMRCAASLLALALAITAAVALRHGARDALAVTLVVCLAILGYAPSVFDLWFRARVEVVAPSLARLATTLASFAAKAVVLTLGLGLEGIAWTVVVEAALSSATMAFAWLRVRPAQPAQALHVDLALARTLLSEGTPFLGSSLIALIAMRADLLLLGLLSSAEQTGLYGIVQRVAEVLAVAPLVLVDSAFPLLARRGSPTPVARQDAGQLLFDLAAAAAWVTTIGAVLLAPLLAGALGSAYADSASLLVLLAWGGIGAALGAARQRWMAHASLQSHAPALALLAAATGIGLALALVPHWGAAGAAWAALGASVGIGLAGPFAFAPLRPTAVMQWRALWPWARLWRLARRHLGRSRVAA